MAVDGKDTLSMEEALDQMLLSAQTIRINQVQMASELKGEWPARALQNCEDAWDRINAIHKRLVTGK